MNDDASVKVSFKNSVTGLKKLEQYETRLNNIKNLINNFPKNFNLGNDYTKKLDTTNKLLINLNKNMSSFKRSTTSFLGNMRTPINETNKALQNISKNMQPISDDADRAAKKFNIAFDYRAVRTFASSLSRVYSGIIKVTQKSSEFLESFNLFQVAFDGNYKEAERFINKMSEMYGLDEAWLTRTVGLFKQLANAMGLSGEAGTKLSMLLTQMSVDLSSLYNIDTANVPPILQSALAGQTKPARRLGSDITQTTLQTTLDSLGIDRSVVNLSYAEKRLLIVISLTKQLTQATNDWGRTLESPANQMRILNEQFSRLTREVGNVFLPILSKILPYLNAIVMVITEIIAMIARLFGYKKEDFDYFNGLTEYIDDVAGGLGEANEGVEKLKRGLRGFDKLNNITTPSASASGVGAGVGGIDTDLMDAFNKAYNDYFEKIKDVKMQATDIRDRIMEWLGFQKNVDEKTRDTYFTFKKITGGTILGALGVGGSLYLGISGIFKIFSKITGLKFGNITNFISKISKLFSKDGGIFKFLAANPKLVIIVATVTALIIAFKKLYDNNEEFRKKVDNFFGMLKQDLWPFLKEIGGYLWDFLKNIWDILKQLWNNVLKPLGQMLSDVLEPVLSTILDILSSLWKNIIEPFILPVLKWLVQTALKAIEKNLKTIVTVIENIFKGLKWFWDNILSPLVNFVLDSIKNYIIPRIETIGFVIDKIKQAIQKVVDWWNNLSFNKKDIKVNYSVGGGGSGSSSYGGSIGGRANGGILVNGQWQPISSYALGGIAPVGQLFQARENGPELVGNIGSHTAVMNNDQIVSSVAYGVENAMTKALRNANSGNGGVYNIYLDQDHKIGTYTLEQLQAMAKSNGKPLSIY